MNRSRSNYFGFKLKKIAIVVGVLTLTTGISQYTFAATYGFGLDTLEPGETWDFTAQHNNDLYATASNVSYDNNMYVAAVDPSQLANVSLIDTNGHTNVTLSGTISDKAGRDVLGELILTSDYNSVSDPFDKTILNLTGKNTYSGTFLARGITIGINEGNNLGADSAIVKLENGGVLGYKTLSMSQNILSALGKNNITASNDTTLTLTGVISGTGELSLGDATKPTGTVRLEGDNSGLTKGITVAGGALEFKEDKNLGAAGNALTMNDNTTLRTTQDTSLSREIVLGDNWNMDTASGSTFTYDGKLTGAKNINKLGDGTFILNSSADVAEGKVKVAGGNMQVGSADHTDIKLTSTGSVDIDAGATLSGYGIVESDINNSGNIQVGSVAPLPATPAATSLFDTITNTLLTVVGNVNNSGEIHLENAAGTAGNELKIDGNYTGTNGKLVLGSVLGDDTSATDKLTITGNATGSTSVTVKNLGGQGSETIEGVEIVSVGGTSDATAFTQDGRIVAGAYDYSVVKGADDANWYLTSKLTSKPVEPTEPTNPTEPTSPPADTSVYRPEVGGYLANLAAAQSMFNVRLHDRVGESQYTDQLTGETAVTSMWLRSEAGHNRFESGRGQLHSRSDREVVQIGGDIAQWMTGADNRLSLGLMTGYGNSDSTTTSAITGNKSDSSVDGYSVGVYATWYNTAANQPGLYVDSWLQWNDMNASVSSEGLDEEEYAIRGMTGAVEAGYSYNVAQMNEFGLWVQPKAQLLWSGVRSENHTESNGTRVATGDNNMQSSVGVRGYLSDNRPDNKKGYSVQPFVEVNYIHNSDPTSARFDGTLVEQQGAEDLVEVKAGMEANIAKNTSLWGDVGYQTGSDNYSDVAGRIGVKYSF